MVFTLVITYKTFDLSSMLYINGTTTLAITDWNGQQHGRKHSYLIIIENDKLINEKKGVKFNIEFRYLVSFSNHMSSGMTLQVEDKAVCLNELRPDCIDQLLT